MLQILAVPLLLDILQTLAVLLIQAVPLILDILQILAALLILAVPLLLDILQSLGNPECLLFLDFQEFLVIPETRIY
jgi:hypothetical protein